MIKNPILILSLIINFTLLYGQSPAIDWQKTIGGNDRDVISTVIHTTDNGVLIGGSSKSNISFEKTENCRGQNDYWVIKLNENSTIEWQKTIGGNDEDNLSSIVQSPDGGYLLGGTSSSNISGEKNENSRGTTDIWIVKLNSFGIIEWQKTIGGVGGDSLETLDITIDGGFILGASTAFSGISGEKTEPDFGESDYWIIKINSIGVIQWQKTFGGSSYDEIHSIKRTSDGGYILSGDSISQISGNKTENSAGWDYWIIKLDSTGNIQWQNTIGGNDAELFPKLIICNDGNFLMGGTSFSSASGDKTENNYGDRDYWIVKLNINGQIVWDKTLGGSQLDMLYSLIETTNNNYIVGGTSYSNISGVKTENSKGLSDFWLIKINSFGGVIWDKTIGGSGKDSVYSFSMLNDSLIIGGTSYSNISGDKTENSRGDVDYWIVKLEAENLSTNDNSFSTIQVYPNPTTGLVTINFGEQQEIVIATLRNVLGQVVSSETFYSIQNTTYPITGANGIYFLNLENESHQKRTIKIIKN
jgi:hypothetical protein